jgi:kinesin family protein C1
MPSSSKVCRAQAPNGTGSKKRLLFTKQEVCHSSPLKHLQKYADFLIIKVAELETLRLQLTSSNKTLQSDLDDMKLKADSLQQRLLTTTTSFDDQMRSQRIEIDDAKRNHRNELDQLRRDNTDEVDRLLRLHRDELRELERKAAMELDDRLRELERRNDAKLEEERSRRLREVQDLESRVASESQNLDLLLQKKDREIQNMRGELEDIKGELDREQTLKGNLQQSLDDFKSTAQKTGAETSSTIQSLESTVASLRARIHFLESGSKAQSDSFAEMEARLQEAVKSAEVSKQKLIKEETLRRILFNQVQELKGNIRVMCRVRPVFNTGAEGEVAKLSYPDVDKESKELEILGKEEKSSLGNITRKNHSFTFDRVFGPESQNQEVFEEISQLVQSALDGYNVCIFCYGQTGSGKTHTMSSADGMIPRATHQIYETATNLKEKGWTYTMEGSFVEVYNEEIHDLLGNSKDLDKKKHEIRHDDSKKQTYVTGLKTVNLDSPDTVELMLKQAANNRSVAATKSNERSSRSHSVFILKLIGRNSTTNETSEGTLNLVDLAGSERLKQSGAEGDRMKETQSINKSLSCLGDVIGALGQGKEGAHIPYRNSKVSSQWISLNILLTSCQLTYLLQYSLGGNSKTLMFVMASPLEAHLTETLTSLKFATKVRLLVLPNNPISHVLGT